MHKTTVATAVRQCVGRIFCEGAERSGHACVDRQRDNAMYIKSGWL